MKIQEKKHRLPQEHYRGEISVAFTVCLKRDAVGSVAAGLSLRNPEIVSVFTDILASVVEKSSCIVPVYCFMPDHQHLIITGMNNEANLWKTIVTYKQKTGFWMSNLKPGMSWQKDFYDHVIRKREDLATQIRYILDNPVRKGLASVWHMDPYKGSIGCTLEDVLNGIM
jgi:REP element-mobilizing transposase RayT